MFVPVRDVNVAAAQPASPIKATTSGERPLPLDEENVPVAAGQSVFSPLSIDSAVPVVTEEALPSSVPNGDGTACVNQCNPESPHTQEIDLVEADVVDDSPRDAAAPSSSTVDGDIVDQPVPIQSDDGISEPVPVTETLSTLLSVAAEPFDREKHRQLILQGAMKYAAGASSAAAVATAAGADSTSSEDVVSDTIARLLPVSQRLHRPTASECFHLEQSVVNKMHETADFEQQLSQVVSIIKQVGGPLLLNTRTCVAYRSVPGQVFLISGLLRLCRSGCHGSSTMVPCKRWRMQSSQSARPLPQARCHLQWLMEQVCVLSAVTRRCKPISTQALLSLMRWPRR